MQKQSFRKVLFMRYEKKSHNYIFMLKEHLISNPKYYFRTVSTSPVIATCLSPDMVDG